jgi:hypothetical protein
MMTIGTKIIWRGTKDTLLPCIREGTITKVGKDTYYVDNQHKVEDQIYAAYCFPDTQETQQYLHKAIVREAENKQWEKEYMAGLYQLRNRLINEGKL